MKTYLSHLYVMLLVFTNSVIAQEPEVKVMQRLLGEGFHRTLFTVVNFSAVVDSWNGSDDFIRNCVLDLKFKLDPGIYVNPDELNDLQRLRKLNSSVKTKVNVEQAANEAAPIELIVSAPVRGGSLKSKLPLHARYHPPALNGGNAMNVIHQPELFINCDTGTSLIKQYLEDASDYCNKQREPMCKWRKLKFNMSSTSLIKQYLEDASDYCNKQREPMCKWRKLKFNKLTESLVWEVPVGNLQHYTLVSFITCAVTVLGSLYLFRSLHVAKMKRLKNE